MVEQLFKMKSEKFHFWYESLFTFETYIEKEGCEDVNFSIGGKIIGSKLIID